jgi:hypothetical protein
MSKTKKYDFRAVKGETDWTAEIIRRVTSSKVVVSKSKSGFSSEPDALEWGKEELKTFLLNLQERNRRRSAQRESKTPKQPWIKPSNSTAKEDV